MKNQSLQFHSHHGLLVCILLLVLLSSSLTTSAAARFLIPKQDVEVNNVDGVLQISPIVKEMEAEDSLDLMGLEHCGNGDEECLQRRMIAEAHLDYIYTQHHKP